MNYSIIQKSQLESMKRLDAEYYQSEFLLVNQTLRKSSIELFQLKDLISRPVVTGSTPKKRDCKEDGTDIKFIKTDVLRDGEIIFDSADCLPVDASRRLSEPRDGDLLVTIIGATHKIVGRAARIFKDDPKMNINQNIALIRPADSVLPGYLETFVRSKFGRLELWQQSRQTEQVNLNCREVENIWVAVPPIPSQEKIERLVIQSRGQKLLSIKLYKQAENLLLEGLGLKDFEIEDDLSFVASLSDVKSVGRIDAEYFQPKYKEIFKKLSSNDNLCSQFDIIKSRNFSYTEEGEYGVIKTKQLGKRFMNFEVDSKTDGEIIKRDKLPLIEDKDVIFASMGVGSLGKTNIFYDFESEKHNFTIDLTLRIFRAKKGGKIQPEMLCVWLNSYVGQELIYKYVVGTSGIISIYENYLQDFPIPFLQKSTQRKIADLVKKSHQARKKARELLEEAKRKVEEMIERGGERR